MDYTDEVLAKISSEDLAKIMNMVLELQDLPRGTELQNPKGEKATKVQIGAGWLLDDGTYYDNFEVIGWFFKG